MNKKYFLFLVFLLPFFLISCMSYYPSDYNNNSSIDLVVSDFDDIWDDCYKKYDSYPNVTSIMGKPLSLYKGLANVIATSNKDLFMYWDVSAVGPSYDNYLIQIEYDNRSFIPLCKAAFNLDYSGYNLYEVTDQTKANLYMKVHVDYKLFLQESCIKISDYTIYYKLQEIPSTIILAENTLYLKNATLMYGKREGESKTIEMLWDE